MGEVSPRLLEMRRRHWAYGNIILASALFTAMVDFMNIDISFCFHNFLGLYFICDNVKYRQLDH